MEYKVSGFVRVYYQTVVAADSPEEAREIVEQQMRPDEVMVDSPLTSMEITVQDVGVYE